MGSLGGPTILTPGAPESQKQGVKNCKKKSTFQNHVKNLFQTVSHRKKKMCIKKKNWKKLRKCFKFSKKYLKK